MKEYICRFMTMSSFFINLLSKYKKEKKSANFLSFLCWFKMKKLPIEPSFKTVEFSEVLNKGVSQYKLQIRQMTMNTDRTTKN